ncbi:hypothetical protein BJ912DRAFT_953355 [Pholiota molesta]|nr:hypothetical protein BJ912DRAFT_953355 [Pholiota molesta]
MVLKPELLNAFATLGIPPESDQPTAVKAYKKLALIHHPDRNHNDPTATERFQQIGAAWDVCQRHYDNPSWGHVPDSTTAHTYSSGATYNFSKDDDIPLDEDELRAFYEYMFMETLFGRYSRSQGQRYRYQRSGGAGKGVFTFSDGFAEAQARQANNTERQRKENEEYKKRKRELELEIEEEERERQNLANKLKADEDRRTTALENAFQEARAGNSPQVQKIILDYDLDVNAVRRRGKQIRKQGDHQTCDTLLHIAASHCKAELVMFLIERGAKTTTLNQDQLTPFHAAIKAGNIDVVHFIMERRGKSFESYHPSKAAPSGRTPLQLAIESHTPAMVELLLKNATTHDVERCWKSESISEEIKQILRMKKGFMPPEEIVGPNFVPLLGSVAEELQRAAINRQKKAERAAKRAAQESEQLAFRLAQEEVRRKAEIEERQRLEDHRKVQEAEKRARELEEIRMRAEAELLAKAEAERLQKVEAERHAKPQVAGRAKTRAERPAKAAAESPATVSIESKESHTRLPIVIPLQDSTYRANISTTAISAAKVPSSNEQQPTKRKLTEDEKKEIHRTKLREKRKAKLAAKKLERQSPPTMAAEPAAASVQAATVSAAPNNNVKKPKSTIPVVKNSDSMDEAQQAKYEATLRRRAEQSARDKERHRQMVEERKRASSQINAKDSPAPIPLTPVPTHATRKPNPKMPTPSVPVDKSSSSASMSRAMYTTADSAPAEDIQTCVVPDDLFKDEKPSIPMRHEPITQVIQSSSSVGTASEAAGSTERAKKRPFRYPRRGRVLKAAT